MNNVRKLTEGATLLAAFAVLLLITIYVPPIGIFLSLALPIPFILFAAKNEWKASLIFLIASLLLSLIIGSLFALPLTLTYGITGAVMGYLIQLNRSRTAVLIAGSMVLLLSLVIQYVVSIAFFHINFIDQMLKTLNDSISMSANILKEMGQGAQKTQQVIEQYKQALDLLKMLIPSVLVVTSFVAIFIIQLLSLPVLRRFGINVANWKPFRELSLPKNVVWYYLLVTLTEMVFHPQTQSYWGMALLNLTFIMQLLMVFQGLTFIYYFCYQRIAFKPLAIIVTVLMLIYQQVLFVVLILGLLDLNFGLRKWLENKR